MYIAVVSNKFIGNYIKAEEQEIKQIHHLNTQITSKKKMYTFNKSFGVTEQ